VLIIEMLKGKIHRATVTEADLNYRGSLTLDEDLMDAVGLKEFEKIQVLDITNGSRLETYIIKGKRGTGEVCINGAAAHLIKKGDLVIIVAYCQLTENELLQHKPKIINVDSKNKVISRPLKERLYL
jgi:aspartate 1-decarboxylase